jgi:hypothetical protein
MFYDHSNGRIFLCNFSFFNPCTYLKKAGQFSVGDQVGSYMHLAMDAIHYLQNE